MSELLEQLNNHVLKSSSSSQQAELSEKLKKNQEDLTANKKSLAESILEQMWILKFGIDRGLDNNKQQAIEDQANSLNGQGVESYKMGESESESEQQAIEDQANSLHGQGVESYKKGDYNDAVKNYKLSLEMSKRLFQGDNQDVAVTYYNLGLAYDEMKDYKSAIEHHKLALEMNTTAPRGP